MSLNPGIEPFLHVDNSFSSFSMGVDSSTATILKTTLDFATIKSTEKNKTYEKSLKGKKLK